MEQQRIPPLNAMNGKTPPYGSTDILRNYHYRVDPKLDQ